MWLGTLFIGLLVCSFFFIGSNGIGDVAQVKSPEVGDVYTFSSGRFGSFDRMKIKSIDEGIAWFVPLPQEVETSRLDAYTSDVEETMDPIPVSFSSLKAMYMKGEIENVSRPLFFK